MELGSVTLKRIGFFCFPIKHSTHTGVAGKRPEGWRTPLQSRGFVPNPAPNPPKRVFKTHVTLHTETLPSFDVVADFAIRFSDPILDRRGIFGPPINQLQLFWTTSEGKRGF
jgi:hypothetical protein